jgi:hypothetical protein
MMRIARWIAATAAAAMATTALARPGPDVTLQGMTTTVYNAGAVGGIRAYSIGSETCNIGNQNLLWLSSGTPGLAMNAYRLHDGRLMQIGLGNCKTACCAAAGSGCGSCNGAGGNVLGTGCKDVYGASYNAGQSRLAPRSSINGYSGAFTSYPGSSGDAIFRRLQVQQTDLMSSNFPGAQYFLEGVYVGSDDAANGNGLNNATYQRVTISNQTSFDMALADSPQSTIPAIRAWRDHGLGPNQPDLSVTVASVDVPAEGRFWYAYKVTNNGNGTWRYDYAVFNLNSDRSGGSFSVPVAGNVLVTNVGFNAPFYHSGEVYSNAPWTVDTSSGAVTWRSPETFAQNANSNALRWGTMYNFWFTANAGPNNTAAATLGLFKPFTPDHVNFNVPVPGDPPPISIAFPSGAPALIAPGTATNLDFQVLAGTQNVQPGSPALLYRLNSSSSFAVVPASSLGGNNYRAVLPAAQCGDTPQFYFRAMSDGGATATLPGNAPTSYFSSPVGSVQTTMALDVDFNGGIPAGWSATGLWHVSGVCAPGGTPCAGSQWAYYGQDASCNYNTTTANSGMLTSPPVVLPPAPPGGTVTLTYCSTLQTENSSNYDRATVLINNTEVDSPPQGASWSTREVNLAAYAGQTVTLSFKFDTVDAVNNNYRGWQIDQVRLSAQSVGCTPTCYANCDGSTNPPVLNVNDFICFQNRFAASESYADCDQNTSLNVNDFICFQNRFASGCR